MNPIVHAGQTTTSISFTPPQVDVASAAAVVGSMLVGALFWGARGMMYGAVLGLGAGYVMLLAAYNSSAAQNSATLPPDPTGTV